MTDVRRKSGLKGSTVHSEGFVYMETRKDALRKNGLQGGEVLGEGSFTWKQERTV